MPPIAAAAAAIATSVTAAGVMTGLMVVGTGLQLAGKITGSKTLGNIGMGLSLAGGVGKIGASLSGTASASAAEGVTSNATNSGISKTLANNTNKVGFKDPFKNLDTVTDVSDSFKQQASNIGSNTGVQQGGGFFSDIKNSLKRYDTTANVLGGMGEAYMQNQGIQMQKTLQDDRLKQEREFREEDRRNLNSGSNFQVKPGIKFNDNKQLYQAPPLLRTV